MNSRSFWDGMLTGGILGAILTLAYISSGRENPKARQVMGKLRRMQRAAENISSGVARAWKD